MRRRTTLRKNRNLKKGKVRWESFTSSVTLYLSWTGFYYKVDTCSLIVFVCLQVSLQGSVSHFLIKVGKFTSPPH